MIVLRRLGGGLFALNPDLVERVEATPDTVLTMVDDKKFLVEETLDEVLQLMVDYRAYIIVRSTELAVANDSGRPTLHVVPNEHVTTLENSLEPGVDLDFGRSRSDVIDAWLDEVDAVHDAGDGADSDRLRAKRGGSGVDGNVSGVDFGAGSGRAGPKGDGSIDSDSVGGGR